MSTLDAKHVATIEVNKIAIVIVNTLAALAGWTPLFLATFRADLIPYFAGLVLLVSMAYLVWPTGRGRLTTLASYRPTAREFFLAGLGAAAGWGLAGTSVLIIVLIIDALTDRIGPLRELNGLYPFACALFLGFIIAVWFVVDSLKTMFSQLYPNAAGIRSPYYEFTSIRTIVSSDVGKVMLAGMTFGVIAVTAALALGLDLTSVIFASLLIILYVIGLPFYKRGIADPVLMINSRETISRLAQWLLAAGYDEVRLAPRTGDPVIDPLLVCVHLYAYGNGPAKKPSLAVQVVTKDQVATKGKGQEEIEWTVAARISTAARMLSQVTENTGGSPNVLPMLVFIDTEPAPSLLEFVKQERVCLSKRIPESVLSVGLAERYKQLAEEYLKLSYCYNVVADLAPTADVAEAK
jgi:hypothetical protein